MIKIELYELIKNYKRISIVGMEKNTGKTTVLNYIINQARDRTLLGLTSIGMDGESRDQVTGTMKPEIYVQKDTVIATSHESLKRCDITRELLENTGIGTAMGDVFVLRALSDGFVELTGPSMSARLADISKRLEAYGSRQIIIDGALDRKSSGVPGIADAVILSTGVSVAESMVEAVERTGIVADRMKMTDLDDVWAKDICHNLSQDFKIAAIFIERPEKEIVKGLINKDVRDAKELLDQKPKYLFIRGMCSDKFLKELIKKEKQFNGTVIIIEDGTKLFAQPETILQFIEKGGIIKVLNRINLVCITVNPITPFGYKFDSDAFCDLIKKNTGLPVFDVAGGDAA